MSDQKPAARATESRAQGLGRIGDWKRRVGRLPLVAIGGLTVERAPGVLAAGADVLSVVTDVTRARDPEAAYRALNMDIEGGGAGLLAHVRD